MCACRLRSAPHGGWWGVVKQGGGLRGLPLHRLPSLLPHYKSRVVIKKDLNDLTLVGISRPLPVTGLHREKSVSVCVCVVKIYLYLACV